jgi:DNA-binding NtrC family response regulator
MRGALAEHLVDEGYDVGAVSSLDGARKQVQRAMPDVLVLDLILGDRSGTELLAELACRADAPATVLLSASPQVVDVARRYQVPMVRKPFDYDVLNDVLADAIADHSAPRRGT